MASRERARRALEVVRVYWSTSSLHGTRHIVREGASCKERLFWALLLTALSAHMLNLCYYQWRTSVGVSETVLLDGASSINDEPFPCVAVCPAHQIDRLVGLRVLKESVSDSNRSHILTVALNREDWHQHAPNQSFAEQRAPPFEDYLEKILVDLHHLTDPGISSSMTFFRDTAPMLMALNRLNLATFMKQVFPSCQTFFHSCLWRGIPFDCCNYFTVRPTDVGYCYFFNKAEADRMVCLEAFLGSDLQRAKCQAHQRLSLFGPGSGLRMYLKTEVDPLTRATRSHLPSLARVSVEPTCTALSMALDTSIFAVPAAAYSLSLDVRRVVVDERLASLPPSARNCLMRHEWPGATAATRKNFPAEYSKMDCIALCRRKYMQSTCGCLVYPFSLGDPSSVCDFSLLPRCIASVTESIRFFRPLAHSPGFDLLERAKGLECSECLPNCDRTTYNIDVRAPELVPGDALPPAARLANRTMLDVFFRGPNTAELYVVGPVSHVGQVLVAIGALANLFLGISFLTVLEGIVVLVKCFWILCRDPGPQK